MKKRLRMLVIILTLVISAGVFLITAEAYAKKIRITRNEAAELIAKFKSAHPSITFNDYLIDSKSKYYNEKFHKNLVINIKKWELLNERAVDAGAAIEKREKAKENSAKLVEKIAKVCAERESELSAILKSGSTISAPVSETAAVSNSAAVKTASSAIKRAEKKESEPEKYVPKTERGRMIKELILKK